MVTILFAAARVAAGSLNVTVTIGTNPHARPRRRQPLTLVLHDWGGALGFDWAYRHQQRVRAAAYMETFVAPLTLEDLPESFRPTLKAVRSSAGEALVLDENMFIEKMLPGVTQRALSADEMAEYRRPFLEAGDDRWPTLQWPREVPLSGEPADVHDRIAAYSAWLRTAPLPKGSPRPPADRARPHRHGRLGQDPCRRRA